MCVILWCLCFAQNVMNFLKENTLLPWNLNIAHIVTSRMETEEHISCFSQLSDTAWGIMVFLTWVREVRGNYLLVRWIQILCSVELYGEVLTIFSFALPVIGVDGNISVYTYSNGNFLWEQQCCQFLCFYYEFQESWGIFICICIFIFICIFICIFIFI